MQFMKRIFVVVGILSTIKAALVARRVPSGNVQVTSLVDIFPTLGAVYVKFATRGSKPGRFADQDGDMCTMSNMLTLSDYEIGLLHHTQMARLAASLNSKSARRLAEQLAERQEYSAQIDANVAAMAASGDSFLTADPRGPEGSFYADEAAHEQTGTPPGPFGI